MMSRDRRDPPVYSAPKSKETRNKILAQVNTENSGYILDTSKPYIHRYSCMHKLGMAPMDDLCSIFHAVLINATPTLGKM